jgi:hypothetical protein
MQRVAATVHPFAVRDGRAAPETAPGAERRDGFFDETI